MRIEVSGLQASLRALSRAGTAATDMKDLMHSTGEIIAEEARSRVPEGETGKLKASIRAGRGKTKATIRAGSLRRVPYAGVIHYGYPARNIEASPYIVDALRAKQREALTHFEAGIRDLLRKEGLT